MTPRDTGTEPGIAELIEKVDEGFAQANKKMDEGFARVDSDIRELRRDTKAGFDKVDKRFEQVGKRLEQLDEKFEGKIEKLDEKFDRKVDRLTSHLLAGAIAIILALIGLIGAVIAS